MGTLVVRDELEPKIEAGVLEEVGQLLHLELGEVVVEDAVLAHQRHQGPASHRARLAGQLHAPPSTTGLSSTSVGWQ